MSKIEELKLFNAVVNPENLPIYYFKGGGKSGKADEIFGLFSSVKRKLLSNNWDDHQAFFSMTIDELIQEIENGNKKKFSIFLEKTEYWYFDVDNYRSALLVEEFFKDRKYIKVESEQPGHFHYYFKVGDITSGYVDKLKIKIHDYYACFSSFSPVLPGPWDQRKFSRIDLDCDVLNMSDLL
jgi:hypothetical protein